MDFEMLAWIGAAACLAGGLAGLSFKRRGPTLTLWLGVLLIAAFVLHLATSMYIMAVDDPWSSGGTIAKHHPDQVLSAPVASFSIVNMIFLAIGSPFVVGCAVGCSNWFRRADHESLRLLACVGTCVGIYIANIVLFFAFWI